ncbi:unnamed protein product [Onchocerca flexuosa]|uniref:Uncharacterized protein n=1 Tax=Onchocerca flexuosa TaxID=387005 RepID=A0A183GZC8_9BILA|nr:unnamed protein product [Onchocerca flexuosa]
MWKTAARLNRSMYHLFSSFRCFGNHAENFMDQEGLHTSFFVNHRHPYERKRQRGSFDKDYERAARIAQRYTKCDNGTNTSMQIAQRVAYSLQYHRSRCPCSCRQFVYTDTISSSCTFSQSNDFW